jgi:quinohemoprotein ethanol dehydrogenase
VKRTLLALALLAAVSCGGDPPAGVSAEAESERGAWRKHGRTDAEQRFSPLDQIDEHNVSELGIAWTYDTRTTRGLEASPIVSDGVLYATASWSVVFALDAKTGRELWRYDPEVPRSKALHVCCDVVNRGAALHRGRIYVGTLDGRLIALDAKTGELVWEVQTFDPAKAYSITGAPRVVKDKVVIGNGGAEYGVRGFVAAYDADTGDRAWRFYTVPGDPSLPPESPAMERALPTWKGGRWWEIGGGGTAWDSIAFDPELDLLYVGTGNGSPWTRRLRSPGGGDNLYLSSILALRPDTGELVWHYQTTPGDSWDYTATQHIMLAELEIDGRERKVLFQAPKNGFFYMLDRATGELLSADAFVPVTWATHVDLETGRPAFTEQAFYEGGPTSISPGPNGGHSWHPMAWNPATGLVYIPIQQIPMVYAHEEVVVHRPGSWNIGIDGIVGATTMGQGEVLGALLAWDPIERRPAWRADHQRPWNGGLLSTAGNLVFQGTGHASFDARRATDGELLFTTPVHTGIVAPPVTYLVDGEQYVAVLAGWGGGFALASADPPKETIRSDNAGRVIVYKLGGTGRLETPSNPRELPAPVIADLDPREVQRGHDVFHLWCITCHGPSAIAGGTIPDLRFSSEARYDALESIVLSGAFEAKGMPRFDAWLDADDVAAIRVYLLDRRAALLAEAAK